MAAETPSPLRFGINHVIAYGQSLSTGWEGWPALSVVPQHDSLMLGHSVRGHSEKAPNWRPVGDSEFHPLRATVQDVDSGELLDPEQVAALSAGDIALGETVLEAALSGWRGRMLGVPGLATSTRRLLASACGAGGRTLEELSKGAQSGLFHRLLDCADAARRAAGASGHDYGVAALLFLQGESNNWALNGSTADRVAYKALLQQFYRDFVADVAIGIAGQAPVPPMFLYQTGGAYASDSVSVPQAQLEITLETPGCFLAAPVYPVTDKAAGHLDANGYRWLGAQFGKVMFRVLTLGQDWKPLYPLHATYDGRTVLATFHVPVAPLAWGRPFVGHRATEIPDKGFTVADAAGVVPIAAVALEGESAVRITLERPLGERATLRYADQRHSGRGCLHDSDNDLPEERYEFDPATGHYPSANIPEMVGRPYPLVNWCVAFSIDITAAPRPASPTAWEVLLAPKADVLTAPPRRGWLRRLFDRD